MAIRHLDAQPAQGGSRWVGTTVALLAKRLTGCALNRGPCRRRRRFAVLCTAGMVYPAMKAMTIQYHPEASPGPHDADVCFEQFVDMMKASRAGH